MSLISPLPPHLTLSLEEEKLKAYFDVKILFKGTRPWSEIFLYIIDIYPLNMEKGFKKAAEAFFSSKLA